jgi:hypothetical protein
LGSKVLRGWCDHSRWIWRWPWFDGDEVFNVGAIVDTADHGYSEITNRGFSAAKKAPMSLWWVRLSSAWVRKTKPGLLGQDD